MTIDERLERLAERHESLTHFVELSAREYERQRAENERLFAANERRMTEVMEGIARVLYTVQQDGENIRELARVAENRERRLTDLEGPPA